MSLAQQTLPTPFEGTQYVFGPYCLRSDGVLLHGSDRVPLPPKELAALRLLLASAGDIVSLEDLRNGIWGGTHVSADSLPRCISSLRGRLKSEDCIQTIYKRGYRFNLAVQPSEGRGRATAQVEDRKERRILRKTGLLRLAILPFSIGEGVPEPFGAGIAEETMLRLSRARNPVVDIVARDSIFSLAARGMNAQQVSKTLHADLALVGTITALPLHIRLRAEMIRTEDGIQLWVEDFVIPHELLAHADARIAKRITARIHDSFEGPMAPATMKSDSGAMVVESRRSEAYSTYLQARHQWNSQERHQVQESFRGFQRALDLDASMMNARVHLMHSYLSHSSFGYMRADTAAELARKQAEITLSLSQGGNSIHPALGWIHFHHDRNLVAANASFGMGQPPGYSPWTLLYRVRFALGQRRFAEAIELLQDAVEVDSYSPMVHGRLAWALHLSGDSIAAVKQAEHALTLFPEHLGVLLFVAIIFASSSRPGGELAARAVAVANLLTQIAPSLDAAYATLAFAQARRGNTREARAILERQQWLCRERFVMRSFHAPALVELGELDEAVDELSTADQQHCPWIFELLADPRLQPLHGNPVFEQLAGIPRKMQSASVA
jgi:DNA-binding winged helix-turn-helix (wHTH) protein/tetratricopeptide (TPR) repeat protein